MRSAQIALIAAISGLSFALALGSCTPSPSAPDTSAAESSAAASDATATAAPAVLADGSYEIEAETDSSMFRSERCILVVSEGEMTAQLSLPGEGFSRIFLGTAEEALGAADADIYDYYLSEDGLYTFDLPVEALDEEIAVAAYGQRRDTWYDHTISFHAPTGQRAT